MSKIGQKSLLVSDNPETAAYLATVLQFLGHELDVVDELDDFLTGQWAFGCEGHLAVFLDPVFGEGETRALAHHLAEFNPHPPLFQLVEGEPAAPNGHINEGLLDVLPIPTRFDRLNALLHKAQLFYETQAPADGGHRPVELFRSLSGNSRAVGRIAKMIDQAAPSEAPALILGEPGTGKEVVARKIHYLSRRHCYPFITVHCGLMSAEVLEKELFPSQVRGRPSYFDRAEGGTLFLNGIDELSLAMQGRLLRLMRECRTTRGRSDDPACDVRVLAGAHGRLDTAVKQGRFIEELYFRLNIFAIEVPPLRERSEDIPLLIHDLATRIEKERRGAVRLSPAAITVLTQYPWPGNGRELANLMEHLAAEHAYGLVDVGQLPEKYRCGASPEGSGHHQVSSELITTSPEPRLPPEDFDLKDYLGGIEFGLIKQALHEAEGVVAHAAKRLNMRRTTLVEKLKKYGLQRSQDLYEY